MAERPEPTKFFYHNIELYKSESLGSGSYGGVCKAKCDGLLCAAKIMHPTLFDLRDPGTATYLSKFRDECHLLSLAKHPNIVQYLGTFTDPDTRLPVLLMELCEESLTAFLERSPGPLSYHVQVDICHNIALALVYLHSNGLIHRDLTGNNVLMIAGPRAKITDFGMSKLANVNPRMTTLTLCPGNVLYMSPEALDEVKSYTAKLDVFSFGVIVIQILTRQFPNPTERFRLVSLPQYTRPLRQEVPDVERRATHLKLIPESHSLKLLALQCLGVEELHRPSALELSERLSVLKQSSQYRESRCGVECNQYQERISELERIVEDKDKELQVNEQQLQSKDREIWEKDREYLATIQIKEDQLQDKEREVHAMQREHQATLRRKDREHEVAMQTKEREHQVTMQTKEREHQLAMQAKEREHQLAMQVKEREHQVAIQRVIVCSDQALETQRREVQTSKELVLEFKESLLEEKEGIIASRDRALKRKERELQASEQLVSVFQLSLEQKDKTITDLQQIISAHEGVIKEPEQQVSNTPHQRIATTPQTMAAASGGRDISKMKWRKGENAPQVMIRGAAAAASGNTAYFRPWGSVKVYSYQNISGEQWSQLPDNPNKYCGLVVLDGLLTSVGGYEHNYTDILLSLRGEGEKKEWSEVFPPMPTSRSYVACVTAGETLVVAGGWKFVDFEEYHMDTVEVMNTNIKQWAAVSSLPIKCLNPSATVLGDKLYLTGGVTEGHTLLKSVFTAPLPTFYHLLHLH